MSGIKFDKTISAGSLVNAVIVCGGLIAGWSNIKIDISKNTSDIKRHETTINKLVDNSDKISQNMAVLTAIISERTGKVKLQQ